MASTEQRTGFRFPWDSAPAQVRTQDEEATGSDQGDPAPAATEPTAPETGAPEARADMTTDTSGTAGPEATATGEPGDVTEATAGDPTVVAGAPSDTLAVSAGTAEAATEAPAHSNRLLDGLVRAMRTAAEETRGASLEQMRAEAKERIEQIHARSGEDVAALRHESDEEIASIRDWSKAEIARIRAETDSRIDRCKQHLDADLEDHAGRVERQIEEVQARVERFEAEMTAFFGALEEIDEPSAFAAAAANLPEPPSLDELETTKAPDPAPAPYGGWFTERTTVTEPAAGQGSETPESTMGPTGDTPRAAGQESPTAALAADELAPSEPTGYVPPPYVTHDDAPSDPQDAGATTASLADGAAEASSAGWAEVPAPNAAVEDPDPHDAPHRSDLDVAEREAAVESEVVFGSSDDDGEHIGQDALAARLAMLAGFPNTSTAAAAEPQAGPEEPDAGPDGEISPSTNPIASTRLVVVGLVSVSAIAAFKRQLVAIEGVRAVGVSSGPDGEFVFKVDHDPIVALQDVLPDLSGFKPRVISSAEGTIQVSASDPDLHS
jgi:hypothetical protein